MFSRWIQVVSCISTHSFCGQRICYQMDIPHFVYQSIHWCTFGLFCLLSVMNKATIDICVQIFIWAYAFISPGYIPRRGVAVSYGDFIFKHLRNFWTVFQSSCTFLHFHQQYLRVLSVSMRHAIFVVVRPAEWLPEIITDPRPMCPMPQKAKRFTDWKAPPEKMRALVVPQIHLSATQSLGFFHINWRG